MAATWTCPSCRRKRRTKFCPECGEERLRPHDLTFTDLASRFVQTFSSVDGKLLRSSRTILSSPGKLTASYIRGECRHYLGPLQLFLIANALFFTVQSVTGTSVLSPSLDSHLHGQDWSAFAQSLVGKRFGGDQQAIETFKLKFDLAATFNAKALIILMAVAFAPIAALLFRGQHRAAGAHIIFALHLYSFVLVVLCIALAIAEVNLLLGGGGLASRRVDNWLSVANLAACAVYIYLAIGAAYSAIGFFRFAATSVLTASVGAIFVGYRFVIFLITFYTS